LHHGHPNSVVYENTSFAVGKAPLRAGISTRGARGMVERMFIYGRPLSPGEVRWLATCSAVNSKGGVNSPWQPTAPHPFLLRVSQGGSTAPSGTVAPVTLPSHVVGYAEHVDQNHQLYWDPLQTPTAMDSAYTSGAFSPPSTATEFGQEPQSESPPRAHYYMYARHPPPGRLTRRPQEPLSLPTMPKSFVGAIASGRSVFTRHMPWALKLKLKLDSAEVGLLHSWQQADDVHDTSLNRWQANTSR